MVDMAGKTVALVKVMEKQEVFMVSVSEKTN